MLLTPQLAGKVHGMKKGGFPWAYLLNHCWEGDRGNGGGRFRVRGWPEAVTPPPVEGMKVAAITGLLDALLAAIIIGRYDLVDRHPQDVPGTEVAGRYRVWTGTQLTFEPWEPSKLDLIFNR